MTKMHLGKWGRSLAVRIPSALVKRLNLSEGDEVNADLIEVALIEAQRQAAEARRDAAMKEIEKRAFVLPPDWKFDREEANWRPAMDRW